MSIDIEIFKTAVLELKIAEQNMDNAELDFIDVAILEYSAKKQKIDALLKQIKKKEVTLNVPSK